MTESEYRADVDGLRAVAVILVLLFHAGLGFPGGFVGVDVFFVISGFLITGLLFKEMRTEGFRLSDFWIRRIRRILPASMVVVAATMVVGLVVLLPDDYEQLAASAAAQQLMASNFYFWKHTNYFGGNAELMPLLHTWSLAVEEQFYLVYPFLLLFLSRFSRRTAVVCLAVLLIVSFGLSEYGVRQYPAATFYLLPARAWELLLGGLLAAAPGKPRQDGWAAEALNEVLSLAGVVGILVAACSFDATTPFPGLAAMLPCAGTALIIRSNTSRRTWVGRLLAARPVVYVGLASYSLYLWHWPILVLLRHWNCGVPLDVPTRVAALSAAFVLAFLSLRYVETPIRKRRVLTGTRNLLFATTATASLLLCFSLAAARLDGLPQRFEPQALRFAAAKDSLSFIHETTFEELQYGDVPIFGAPAGRRTCMIWGDSHAMALLPGLDGACKACDVRGLQVTTSATPPLLDFVARSKFGLKERAPAFNRSALNLAIGRRVDFVVLACMWADHADRPDFEPCLDRTVDELARAGIHVGLVRDVAIHHGDIPMMLTMAVHRGTGIDGIGLPLSEHRARNQRADAALDRLKEAHRGAQKGASVTILDPAPWFVNDKGLWQAQVDGIAMVRDFHHLTVEGGLRLTPMFEALFDAEKEPIR